ncbi:MAG: type VII secretion target [Actinomycetota bacterium]|nr:type VII secretion target [Actinomycetota bacterium]
MTDVTVQNSSLAEYARGRRTAADVVRAHADAQRGEVGDLTDTFGVIGADFLVAAGYTLDARARRLDTLATRHDDQGRITDNAATAYGSADERSGRRLSRPPTGRAHHTGHHDEGLYL